jgi:hypothetical protein
MSVVMVDHSSENGSSGPRTRFLESISRISISAEKFTGHIFIRDFGDKFNLKITKIVPITKNTKIPITIYK